MKKIYAIILCFVLFCTWSVQVPVFGSNSSEGLEYRSLSTMVQLGVFEEEVLAEPDGAVTREEYAQGMISISGQESKIDLYANNSLFSDAPATDQRNGVIGMATALGYITGMADGLFHPEDPITYSQLAVGIAKLLGYNDNDLVGNWPYNYLNLLESLEIVDGIAYAPQGEVSWNDFAAILNRTLQTEMKDGTKLFIEATGILKNITVIENGDIRTDLDPCRVLTEEGVFYMQEGMATLEPGYHYIVRVEENIIQAFSGMDYTYQKYSIQDVSQNDILLNNGKSLQLPENIIYYYGEQVLQFDSVMDCLKANSSVMIALEDGEAQYGVLYDPVYSSPKIITEDMTRNMLETLYADKLIDREGKSIRPAQLEVNDVAYEVTDIWNQYGFILVFAEEVNGDVTAILPNLMAPVSIELDGILYELDSSFPKQKMNGTGTIEVDQTVTLLLGENGKVVDAIISGSGENDHYVLVLDAYSEKSLETENFGENLYFVNLLHTDGNVETYLTQTNMSILKGDLATYEIIGIGDETDEDYDTVSLTGIEYHPKKTYEVYKDERKLNNAYVTDNVIIFNMIHNVYGRNSDASVLKWSELPAGKLEASKVKYIHTTGDFQDIDIIYLDNVLDEGIAYGLVTDYKTNYSPQGTQQTITMLIEGEEYVYTTSPVLGISTGGVLKLRMSDSGILSIEDVENPYTSSSTIQAADTSRVRMNDTTYSYHRDFAVYEMKTTNTGTEWKRVGTDEINKETERVVTLYLDKPLTYGGKVVMALIR